MAQAFTCRICKEKFNLTIILTDTSRSSGFSVVSTQCGHLFHKKCLEAALTNQKLLHAKHGRGPLRRFCPVARCNADIPSEDAIITISFPEDEHNSEEEDSENSSLDAEVKLVKRIQALTNEKGKLVESVEKANNEIETLRSVIDEIKFDLSDIQSFLKDDRTLRKGDLIFWATRDGTYAPGKVLEIRKKPGENVHYAIVKLDNKTKVSGVSPYAVNRDTLILPITDLTTYKAFFKEFFDKFQAKFEFIMVDLNCEIQGLSSPAASQSPSERSAGYYRSTRKFSRTSSKSSVGTAPQNVLEEIASISVDSVPVPAVRKNSQPQIDAKTVKLARSVTVHYGIGNEPRRLEKCRSLSWATPPTTSSLDTPSLDRNDYSRFPRHSFKEEDQLSISLENEGGEDDDSVNEFIKDGERVIWFDTYSEYEQIGIVAAVCEFSPCAIVKFDEHPIVKHKFQYRTISLDELFPYDLASPEDKFRIAEIYGKIDEFVEGREHLFSISNEDSTSDCEEVGANADGNESQT